MSEVNEERVIYELKWNYNYLLSRYLNGWKYLSEHPDEVDKWKNKLNEILEDMHLMLEELRKDGVEIPDKNILAGFRLDPDREYPLL